MTIADVKKQPSGLFVITDDAGERYATKDPWKASVAEEARKGERQVSILSFRGWFYRDLRSITVVAAKEQCA